MKRITAIFYEEARLVGVGAQEWGEEPGVQWGEAMWLSFYQQRGCGAD